MNDAELAKNLASDRFSEAECKTLLEQNDLRAADYLRAFEPERAFEVAVLELETRDHPSDSLALIRLLDHSVFTYGTFLDKFRDPPATRKELARPLAEWLELGRDEHLERLMAHGGSIGIDRLKSVLPLDPALVPRVWRLVEPVFGATLDEQLTKLIECTEKVQTAGAHYLAAQHGIELMSLGVGDNEVGTKKTAQGLKPVLELAWRANSPVFHDLLAVAIKEIRAWEMPWMLDFLEANVEMVDAGEQRMVVLQDDRIVATGSGKLSKNGKAGLKIHRTPEAAAKDYEKRLAAAEAKLGGTRTQWDGFGSFTIRNEYETNPNAALRIAVERGWPNDVEGLLRRGVDPNETSVTEYGDTVTPLQAAYRAAPGPVRRLIEAGARNGLETRLLADGRGDERGNDPYLFEQHRILLVKAGADVNARFRGWTALHYAASARMLRLIDALVEAGADPNAPAGREAREPGQTPAEVAEAAGNFCAAKHLRDAAKSP